MHIYQQIVSCCAGVRYLFIGKIFEHRPSYHLLGILLFLQLAITSASWALDQSGLLTPLLGSQKETDQSEALALAPNRQRKAAVLEVQSHTVLVRYCYEQRC